MKAKRTIIPATLVMIAVTVMTGCEYDPPTAVYDQPQKQTLNPTISGINPSETLGGVNYITITGTNFSSFRDSNSVYFSGFQSEIVEHSTTSIKVRRPNKSGDSIQVNVVVLGALEVATMEPYKISSVCGTYGGFITGVELSALTLDQNNNLYVIERMTKTVHKITPDGTNTPIGSVSKFVTDTKATSDGKLILLTADTRLRRYDLTTHVEDTLTVMPKRVSFADFDQSGNLYAGGTKTDLYMLKTDLTIVAAGEYAKYDIKNIRVYNGYVYVLADNSSASAGNPAKGIWRHQIGGGVLGAKELYLDWSTTGDYAVSEYSSMEFSSDGKLYIATDNPNPILMMDAGNPAAGSDILYKDIIPSRMTQMAWGESNYMYALNAVTSGTTTTWNLYRIDMGQEGAPR